MQKIQVSELSASLPKCKVASYGAIKDSGGQVIINKITAVDSDANLTFQLYSDNSLKQNPQAILQCSIPFNKLHIYEKGSIEYATMMSNIKKYTKYEPLIFYIEEQQKHKNPIDSKTLISMIPKNGGSYSKKCTRRIKRNKPRY